MCNALKLLTRIHPHWQVLKFSRPLNYSELCAKEFVSCVPKKIQEKLELDDLTK